MLYKVVRNMVPAVNADEFLIPIRNKRNIKPRVQSDFHTTNIVEKFSTIHSECSKYRILTQNNIETHSLLEL